MAHLWTGISWIDNEPGVKQRGFLDVDPERRTGEGVSHSESGKGEPSMDGKFWDKNIAATELLDLEAGDRTLDQYKTHLATRSNSGNEPLDTFVRSWSDWVGWNRYRKNRNIFSRPFIFSMIDFYPENNKWLFGGVFRVLERRDDEYEIELADLHRPLIGRLLIDFDKSFRRRDVKLEKYIDDFSVARILQNIYEGQSFPGFRNVELTFPKLQEIVRSRRRDWRAALGNVQGIYLITDTNNGQKYVGSAYGDSGIWGRWKHYAQTGHGGDQELRRIVEDEGKEYAVENFKVSLLEHHPMHMTEDEILRRESYWKRILLSREYGYNNN